MGLEQASWRCLDWGPDSIAASCNCWNGLVCWIGLAKLRSSERAEESRGSTLKAKAKAGKEQRASKLPEKRLATTAMPLKQWYLVLAYDGTDFAGWQRQSEVKSWKCCASCVVFEFNLASSNFVLQI